MIRERSPTDAEVIEMANPSPRAVIAARAVLALVVVVTVASSCRSSSDAEQAASATAPATTDEPATSAPDAASPSPKETASSKEQDEPQGRLPAAVSPKPYRPKIVAARFTTKIDNPYYPLAPGTSYTFEGVAAGLHETDTVTVTHQTKVIMHVRCVVVRDEVRTNGQLTELTFDWYAQDRDGNVWYFGEDSHEYSSGSPVSAFGSWQAGVAGAQPGIVMPGSPERGQRYRQEYRQGQAEDMAEILRLGDTAKVPYKSFHSVIVTKDWSPLEPGIVEQKYYASGVGVVQESLVQGGYEVSRLVKVQG
jgi:hypothetical protein